jgi:hypothetical protein
VKGRLKPQRLYSISVGEALAARPQVAPEA